MRHVEESFSFNIFGTGRHHGTYKETQVSNLVVDFVLVDAMRCLT